MRRRLFEEHLTHVPFSYLSLKRRMPDLAQALYPTDALAAARWSERTGRPAVLSFMGIPHRRALANRRWRIEILQRAMRGSAAVTTLSQAAADGFRRWLGVETRVIHPGIDLELFRPAGERAEAPTILCSAAAGEPRKRVELLVRSFAKLRAQRPNAQLRLNRPRDATLAAALAREPGVETVDLDGSEALSRAYSEAWVSVLPSLGEAFGLVCAESLACGTPVVGTRDGGIPEIIGEGEGEVGNLFGSPVDRPAEDEAELCSTLLETLELAPAAATRERCRARAAAFSIELCAERHEQLYRELVEGA